MTPGLVKVIGAAIALFLLLVLATTSSYVVEPGTRGVRVTLGRPGQDFVPAGFGFKAPLVTRIELVSVRQRTVEVATECYSSDLQQVGMSLRVLYRIPEESVVQIFTQYAGDPFDSLIAPRVQEALKEAAALHTAEQIVKNREQFKLEALEGAREKIGPILRVEDIVIRDLSLSPELEQAIEAKMVAEQQAAQARFTQLQTQVEAETAVIRAKGEAEAIRVRGEALRVNPAFLRLQIVERWDGRSPLVVPADPRGTGAGLLLPIGPGER
jgi:prohibitin 2